MNETNSEQTISKKDKFAVYMYCKRVFIDLEISFSKIVSKLNDINTESLTVYDLVHIYNMCDRINTILYNLKCYINIDERHVYRDTSIVDFLITEGIVTDKDLNVLDMFREKINIYNHILTMKSSIFVANGPYFITLIYKLFNGETEGRCANLCISLAEDIAKKLDEKMDEMAKTIKVKVKTPETDE